MAAPKRKNAESEDPMDGELSELAPIFRRMFDDFFTPRANINWEQALALQDDPEFLARLEQIRQKECVPKNLKEETDIRVEFVSYGDDEKEVVESYFLDYELDAPRRMNLEREIKSILIDFALPLNFHDWVQSFLLYRKKPKGTPRYNWGTLDQVMADPQEVKRIPLSSVEKKFWLCQFRHVLGIKIGRVPQKYAALHKRLKGIFANSKNVLRRSRRMADTFDLIDLQKKSATFGQKLTYRDAVAELTGLETEEEFKRGAAKLRQRKSRYLRRLQKLKKPRK